MFNNEQVPTAQLVILPKEKWEALNNKLDSLLEAVNNRNQSEMLNQWIESAEARKMLGVSQKTWQTYRDTRVMPFSQFGRKIYVKKSDLDSFMVSHYIKKGL